LRAALHDGATSFARGFVIFCGLIKHLKNIFEDIHTSSPFTITGNGRCAYTLRTQRVFRLRIDRVMMVMCVIVRMIVVMMVVLCVGHR